MKKYDVVVIGGGPAGYPCAIKCAQNGKNVCLIEEMAIGGVCLNRGCIPTKSLYTISKEIEKSKFTSIKKETSFSWQGILSEILTDVVMRLRAGVNMLLKSYGIEVIAKKKGEIIDNNVVRIENEEIYGENIVIATGSLPFVPDCFKNDERVISSEQLWKLTELPESIGIIGGGFIGCEYASILSKFGVEVTIYEMMDALLLGKDKEITNYLKNSFEKRGIKINLGKPIKNSEEIKEEKIIVAVGRRPNLPQIPEEIEKENGWLKTDEKMKTNIKNIYAIGDINGKFPLAYVATKEGEISAENISGKEVTINYDIVPEVIFTDPQIGVCGLTEEQAKAKGINVSIGKFPYNALGRACADKKTDGFVKVISNSDTDEIVGIHIIGELATELVSFSTLTISNGLKIKDVEKIFYCHPTFSEGIMEGIMDLKRKSVHLPPKKST